MKDVMSFVVSIDKSELLTELNELQDDLKKESKEESNKEDYFFKINHFIEHPNPYFSNRIETINFSFKQYFYFISLNLIDSPPPELS